MIRYRIDLDPPGGLHAHQFRVTLSVPAPEAEQLLSLPVWIPGSYLVREFARHLSGLEARQGDRALPLEQRDKATWLVRCSGRAALTVSYRVYANDPSVRAAFLDAQRGFFNGTSVFLRVHGREREPQQLQLGTLPAGWEVATAMTPSGAGGRRFEAADYDELVDHPVELGRFWRGAFKAHGVPHEFVVAGALPSFDGERLLADARAICEAQIAFWHGGDGRGGRPGRAPFRRYLFLLNAVDDGYGGLEHRASTALIAARRDLPRVAHAGQVGKDAKRPKGAAPRGAPSEGYTTLLGLISHEYFHSWNVKRLKPAELEPYDYTRENYTELLWFFEGFTSYYDDLLLRRAGLIDTPRYLKGLAKAVNQVLGTPGRAVQSLARASFDAWVKYYRPDENTVNATVSYYTKGSLVALALDLTLRAEGRGTLDDVMRRLWSREAVGADGARPVSEADIAAALQEVGGRSYERELAAWVHGTDELPLREALARLGVAWSQEPPTLAQRLGARVGENGGQLKLQAVMRGGLAEQTGLAAGDELIALDGWRLRRLDDLAVLGAFRTPLPLLAARDQRLLSLTLPALPDGGVPGAVGLSVADGIDAPTAQRRAAWLGDA
jgi:predicted metalloprotease with PDZ domain